MNIIIVLLIALAGLAGAWYHWVEVKKRGETGSFFGYFFHENTDGTKAACVAFLAAMETVYIAGGFNGLELAPVIAALMKLELYPPLISALVAAFGAGYACDSKLNSGTAPEQGDASPKVPAP